MKDGIHGKWEMTYNGMRKNLNTGLMMTIYHCKCSVCGWETGNQGTRFSYCHNCGTNMDEVNQPKDSDYMGEKYNKCIELATHAIGLDRKKPYKRNGRFFYRPYRNYYDASPKDCEVWDVMVSEGYAGAGRKDRYGGRMYWLTRKGLDWLGEKLEIHIYEEED